MRTAYINKENKVVYIAAFAEDKIQADSKGKLRFGGSQWDGEKYIHSLSSGEEVFAVDGAGLGLGDIYKPMDAGATPEPPEPADTIAALESEVQNLEENLKLEFLKEKIDPVVFDVWVEEKANA